MPPCWRTITKDSSLASVSVSSTNMAATSFWGLIANQRDRTNGTERCPGGAFFELHYSEQVSFNLVVLDYTLAGTRFKCFVYETLAIKQRENPKHEGRQVKHDSAIQSS